MDQTNPALPVLGRVPSGLFILTAKGPEEHPTGMLSSWVMQAGFAPPMVSVAIKQGRYICDWLTSGLPFNLNLLAEDQHDMLVHFGRGFEPGEPAFTGLSIDACSRGIPVLSEIVGHLECEPASHVDSGDHRIFLARIIGGRLVEDTRPMTHIRKNGGHY